MVLARSQEWPQKRAERFAVSWLRAYSTRLSPKTLIDSSQRPLTAAAKSLTDLNVRAVLPGDSGFYDVQVTRERHVARVIVDGISMTPEPRSGPGEPSGWHATVLANLLFFETGFVVIRLTIASITCADATPLVDDVRTMSRAVFSESEYVWSIESEGGSIDLRTDVRGLMDVLFFELQAKSVGHKASLEEHVSVVERGWESRYRHLESLVDRGHVLSAYPVVFGSHVEFDPTDIDDHSWLVRHLALEHVDQHHENVEGLTPVNLRRSEPWYIRENTSVVFVDGDHVWHPELATFTPSHTQLLEYLTLQRGGLRAVQRATQLTITDDRPVSRGRVADWSRIVASVTDGYVLHDQMAKMLEPVQRHLHNEDDLRDPAELRDQVSSNLDSFQSALDARTDRAAVVLSLLFGIVAATALVPMVNQLAIVVFGLDVPVEQLPDAYPRKSLLLNFALVAVVGIGSYGLFRRVTRGGMRRSS